MHRFIKLLLLLTPFTLISCLDVVEEFDFEKNKSGKVTYTFNLSQSKLKLNTLLKLDSVNGFRVPKLDEVEQKMAEVVKEIKTKAGIKTASYSVNNSDFIYTISISFSSIKHLDNALRDLSYWKYSKWKPSENLYEMQDNTFEKDIELLEFNAQQKSEIDKNSEMLKQGKYTFVLRSKDFLEAKLPKDLKLSGSETAVMLRKNMLEIANNDKASKMRIVFK